MLSCGRGAACFFGAAVLPFTCEAAAALAAETSSFLLAHADVSSFAFAGQSFLLGAQPAWNSAERVLAGKFLAERVFGETSPLPLTSSLADTLLFPEPGAPCRRMTDDV